MKTRSAIIVPLMLIVSAATLFAAAAAPTQYNSYDGFAPGARAIAMGGAFVAVADDASAVYYNPAGLADNEKGCVSITYEATRQSELTTAQIFAGESLSGSNLQNISFISAKGAFTWRPLANSTWQSSNGPDWEKNEVKINAYTVSASHQENQMRTGLNLTYMSGQIAQSSIKAGIPSVNISDGYGFAMDFGFLYTVSEQIRFGLNFKNLAGYMWWQDYEKDQLPFILKSGVDFQIKRFTNFSTEWEKRYYRKTDEQNITRFGIEQMLGNILALRAGIAGTDLNDKENSSFSGGIGYMQNAFELSLTAEKYRVDMNDVYRYVISVNIPI